MSVVRFRPRPPNNKRPCSGAFLFGGLRVGNEPALVRLSPLRALHGAQIRLCPIVSGHDWSRRPHPVDFTWTRKQRECGPAQRDGGIALRRHRHSPPQATKQQTPPQWGVFVWWIAGRERTSYVHFAPCMARRFGSVQSCAVTIGASGLIQWTSLSRASRASAVPRSGMAVSP